MPTSLVLLVGLVLPQNPPLPERLVAPRGLRAPVPPGPDGAWQRRHAALGQRLFDDPILSVDRQISCRSCHRPERGFASVEALPPGSLGRRALRHAPSLYNRAWGRAFGWDGRAADLEEQVILPIANPNEMALPLDQALQRLRDHQRYRAEFHGLFGRDPQRADLARVLSSYVRSLTLGDSRVDRFRHGDRRALNAQERAGLWIYESKGACWRCHSGPNFSDERFHNTGVGWSPTHAPPGRRVVTGRAADQGRFKTPTLRGVSLTAPYMHDGSLPDLRSVVEFYRRGGNANPALSRHMRPLSLSNKEVESLVAFLRALGPSPAK